MDPGSRFPSKGIFNFCRSDMVAEDKLKGLRGLQIMNRNISADNGSCQKP